MRFYSKFWCIFTELSCKWVDLQSFLWHATNLRCETVLFDRFGQNEKRVAPLCSCSEDVAIDLGIIATRIEIAPYCRIINAALEPLRQVLKVAALLAKVLGEIFGAIVFALVSLLEIFERTLIPIAQICLVSLAAFLAKGGIFFDFIERAFAHAAFTIPLFGEVLVILKHELGILLIRMQAVAKLDLLAVGFKGGQINPHSIKPCNSFITPTYDRLQFDL